MISVEFISSNDRNVHLHKFLINVFVTLGVIAAYLFFKKNHRGVGCCCCLLLLLVAVVGRLINVNICSLHRPMNCKKDRQREQDKVI